MEEFSKEQIDFLQDEFDRQRDVIKKLGVEQSDATIELERLKKSYSYKIGRYITAPFRYVLKLGKKKEDLVIPEVDQRNYNVFPEILIDSNLVPTSREASFNRALIQNILALMGRRLASSNEYRDLLKRKNRSVDITDIRESVWSITNYILVNAGYRLHVRHFFVGSLRFFILNDPKIAMDYYKKFGEDIVDDRAIKDYVRLLMTAGEVMAPYSEIKKMKRSRWRSDTQDILEKKLKLLNGDFVGEVYPDFDTVKESGNVMYCVSQSRPFTTNGYAIRTHEIAKSIRTLGKQITVCPRFGYPLDRSDFSGNVEKHNFDIEGINYEFNCLLEKGESSILDYSKVFNLSHFEEYHDSYAMKLFGQVERHKPEVIHAASNFVVGMAAVNVARSLGIPSVYEIRGFWHDTQASKRFGYLNSDHYNISESMEIEVAKRADCVLTITNSIADILVKYGVEREKISVLPNCVDPARFKPQKRDSSLEEEFELYEMVVIGYVGSFVEYEGLDILLESLSGIKEAVGEYFRVLLVGDGPERGSLENLAEEFGLTDIVTFTGRVPHDEVSRYYSLIDIAPFPRKGRRVCELVSPLKPFEAMSMGKSVVVSDVGALREFIIDGKNGMVHKKDDSEDLGRCIQELVLDHKLRSSLGLEARNWVTENRTWEKAGEIIETAYSNMLQEF